MRAQRIASAGLLGVCFSLAALPVLALTPPRPPAQITITNARTVTLDTLEISTTGAQPRLVAKLAKPLAAGKTVTVKLNKPAGCAYYVLGRFSDAVESDNGGINLCEDKVIRLTD